MVDGEVAFLATEGLYNGLLMVCVLLLLPLLIIKYPYLLIWPVLIDLLLFVIPTLTYTAKRRNYWGIYRYFLHFYLIRALSSLVFLRSFLKVVLGIDLSMGWFRASRYDLNTQLEGEGIVIKPNYGLDRVYSDINKDSQASAES